MSASSLPTAQEQAVESPNGPKDSPDTALLGSTFTVHRNIPFRKRILARLFCLI